MWFRGLLSAFCLVCFLAGTAQAGKVSVEGKDPRKKVTLHIEDVNVVGVINHVSEEYGFDVKGLEKLGKREPLSLSMSGRLDILLGRLLRNWNYVIVRSPDNQSGIEKVVIINANYGASERGSRGAGNRGSVSERIKRRFSANQERD